MPEFLSDVIDIMLGREAFIIATDEESHATKDSYREFSIHDSEHSLLDTISDLDTADAGDLRVIHGVITRAETIPIDLKGKTPFVVALITETDDGFLTECSATHQSIEETIKDILNDGIAGYNNIDIDSIYIVYGYELTITLSVSLDEVDDETIHSCRKLAKIASKLSNRT